MAKKNGTVARLPAPEPVVYPVAAGILPTLRTSSDAARELVRQLGELTASYEAQKAVLLRRLSAAQAELQAGAKNALLAAGVSEADLAANWDLDLAAGTVTKRSQAS